MSNTAGPRCPNHAVPLTDCHKGIGICPLSGCEFTYKADEQSGDSNFKIDKFGKKVKKPDFAVTQMDGGSGG